MRSKFFIYLITLIITLGVISSKHPIKLTATLIEYKPESKMLRVECKVFIDDFENSINKLLAKDINVNNLSKEDKEGIEEYFGQNYKITINDAIFPLKYMESEVIKEANVFSIKFEPKIIQINKGDRLFVANTLFFTEFGYKQSNRITFRIPPYITEENFESTLKNYKFTKSF